jgi:hypothetical protein
MIKKSASISIVLMCCLASGYALAQDGQTTGSDFAISRDNVPQKEPIYSPYVGQSHPDRVYWGDSHLHTSYSWDAGLVGNTLGPDEAYRFAKGVGRQTHDLYKKGDIYGAFETWGFNVIVKGNNPLTDENLTRSVWEEIIDHAEAHNQPGAFTAFIGYEWSAAPAGNNLHRVVVMRDGGDKAKQVLPFGSYDSDDPEDLWRWMAGYQDKTGGRVFAIPHNGNLSNGMMFATETLSGRRINRDYAEQRSIWEPLYEVTQMKGDGEAHPFLSPNDEFADYENWDRGNWNGEAKKPGMLPHEYARSALKIGLQQEERLGVNPFKFGLVGATDAHTSLATTREENNFGKVSVMEPGSGRFEAQIVPDPEGTGTGTYEFETIASGLQGVWARENTRESLWDAMMRKETYATTGTRMTVRVFAGWDYDEKDVLRPDFARTGYLGGVPMGGDLTAAPDGKATRLMIRALRDPDGANLDRVQIIKGWLDGSGDLQEKIYDAACSDDRPIGANNRCDGSVGNTVNVAAASYTNDIGDALLMAYWEDPDFNADERAFYYVRVLEIPTPRWTTYDAAFYGVDLPDGVPAIQQDRAYTSPIWYTP